MFLAMPLIAALKAVCTHVPDWQPWANLIDTRDEAPPKTADSDDSLEDTHLVHFPKLEAHVTQRSGVLRETEKVEER